MFGRLTIDALNHEMSQNLAVIMMSLTGVFLIALISYLKKWRWLWDEWLTSLDPKKIGIMYFVVSLIMFLKGVADALMIRIQQALSVGDAQGFISPGHFQEVFSAHGTTMIFFVGMGIIFGLMNLIVPLQIGARDVAFPFLNSVSFWLFASASMLTLVSLAVGSFSAAGWLAYPPLSGLEYSPGEGVDYWIWMLQIAGVGSTLGGINFFVTILKMRCPGMTLMKMPIFTWSCLGALILIIFAFPILTATLAMLALDRYLGMHFFTAGYGGSPMLYVNMIWAWGHPEVYILILPVFGVFSEVVPTFSEKKLFGYVSMIWAIILIAFLSFVVWVHHFFTMGAGPGVNTFFAIMTMLIAVPTGVKVFNWLFTKYKGRVHFKTPMLWFFGFVLNFSVGGMTGILLSAPPIDYEVHNSLFLIAHFHGMVVGSMLFGVFAAFAYWFPKVTGFRLNEKLGIIAFWFWFVGFLVAFMPLYMLGFMGATRRIDHYPAETGWQPFFFSALVGVFLIFIGVLFQILQLFYSIKNRKQLVDITGDPWNGRTLEWTIPSPPPVYNFGITPIVNERDPFWALKEGTAPKQSNEYEDILVPANNGMGFYIGVLSLVLGFCLTWYIYWMALIALVGIILCLIIQLSSKESHDTIPAEEVKQIDMEHTRGQNYAWKGP